MNDNRLVTVIIVNYNGRQYLGPCLVALEHQSFRDFDILLVDNGSTDGSLDFVTQEFPNVKSLSLPRNYGFGIGNNRGIELTRSPLIALLNNDTEPHPQWLAELVKAIGKSPEVGMCASRLVYAAEPTRIDSAGDDFFWFGQTFTYRHYSVDHEAVQHPRFCLSACAAAALYRRSMLEEIGGFDPLFSPAYYEDIDLGFRALLRGYRCLYVPTAVVLHHVSATGKRNQRQFVYLNQRNIEYVLLKNYPLCCYLSCLPVRLLYVTCCFVYYLVRGMAGPFLKAKYDFLMNLPAVLQGRSAVQKSRTITCSDFRRMLKGGWLRYRMKLLRDSAIR